jgi:hypothetical protein
MALSESSLLLSRTASCWPAMDNYRIRIVRVNYLHVAGRTPEKPMHNSPNM